MENNYQSFYIRQIQPGEEKTVLGIMRRTFPLFMRLTFSVGMIRSAEHVLVACVNGEIKGGVLLKTFVLPDGGKGGVVDWVFTDSSGRGLGLGARLMDESLDWFNQVGCDEIFAIVEGFNTNSSNLFARRGFSIFGFREQVQRFGFPGFAKVWFKTFHFMDLGHFLWGRPAQLVADSPSVQLAGAILLNMFIALLAGLRGWNDNAGWGALTALPLWVLILLVLRNVLMMLTARFQGMPGRYRLWETGFVISLFVVLVGGAFIPIPGSIYPSEDIWKYQQRKSQLGKTALAGSLPALLVSVSLFLVGRFLNPSSALESFLTTGFSTAFVFAVADILLPFFPFVSFNGRRLWDWNRWVWGIMATVVIIFWVWVSLNNLS